MIQTRERRGSPTLICLDQVPDSAPDDAVMFQVAATQVNLLALLQWLAQGGLLGVHDDAIALYRGG